MKQEKKYRLTDETIEVDGKTLYRIEALRDFSDVKKGDKGGYVESEANLSQEGDCWVYGKSMVFDNAKICDNAKIFCDPGFYVGDLYVYDNAQISGNVIVHIDFADSYLQDGDIKIFGNAKLSDSALVVGNDIEIYDNAKISNYTRIVGHAHISNVPYKNIDITKEMHQNLLEGKILAVKGLVDDSTINKYHPSGKPYDGFIRYNTKTKKFEDISKEQFEQIKKVKLKETEKNNNTNTKKQVKQNKPKRGFKI